MNYKSDVYFRNFSQIDCVQKQKTVKYSLTETVIDNVTHYGVRIVCFSKDFCEQKAMESISTNKNLVQDLLLTLYENSVDIINFKDVVHDYLDMIEYK